MSHGHSSLSLFVLLGFVGLASSHAIPYQVALAEPGDGGDVFVEITVPSGVVPAALSHDGVFDAARRTMKWGPLPASGVPVIGFDLPPATGNATVTTFPAGVADLSTISLKADSAGDGLSDEFESTFGVTTPGDDDDGDGFDNLTEQEMGTDPTNPMSRLFGRSVSQNTDAGTLEIRIPAEIGVAGLKVQTTTALSDPLWRSVPFSTRIDGADLVIGIDLAGLRGSKNFFRVLR